MLSLSESFMALAPNLNVQKEQKYLEKVRIPLRAVWPFTMLMIEANY